MFKNEKQILEEVFILAGLCLLASGATTLPELREPIEEVISKLIGNKDRKKIDRRICEMNRVSGVTEMITDSTHGHKFVLIWHSLTEMLINGGKITNEEIINCFDPFLEIESKQIKDDGEWLKMKKSSEKQAKKLLERLNNGGYYVK